VTDQLDRLKAALADRYAIEREIGSGGIATVYLAGDLKHSRHAAVSLSQSSERDGVPSGGLALWSRVSSRPSTPNSSVRRYGAATQRD